MNAVFLIAAASLLGLGHGWVTKWIWIRLLPGSQTKVPAVVLASLLVVKLLVLAAALIVIIQGHIFGAAALPASLRLSSGVGGFLVGLAGFVYFQLTVDRN